MLDLIQRVEFWVAMIFAMVVKFRASEEKLTKKETVWTVVVAVCGALLFTEPTYTYLGFTTDSGKFACCAIVALSSEHIARKLLGLTVEQVFQLWRGK